jgi:hypothetical protein
MADYTISPNMGLSVPAVGVDPSPDWANNLNASLSILDGHNHGPGSGVQITPDGININADLAFQTYNAISLRSARFTPQSAPLSLPTDLDCLYVSGVDLYYNDGNGNQVKITSGGAVNATSSGISSGTATASFVAGVLVVDSAANTPANIQAGSVLIGNNVAASNFVTVSAPNSLASSYGITLPLLPASNLPVSVNASGVMSAAQITYAQLSPSLQTAPTKQIFLSGSGIYTPTSSSIIWIEVEMVGDGGGGGGGTSSGTSGGAGSGTTFSVMTASGGSGGGGTSTFPGGGAGGSASLGSGPIGIALTGASGTAGPPIINFSGIGGPGTPFGGGGGGSASQVSSTAPATPNTGSGGASGPGANTVGGPGGSGGAGGYIKAIISGSLLSGIISGGAAYSVGPGGTAGGGPYPGGAGGSGIIVVTEYYCA